MREINEYKKRKVIKLFLTGVSYDEITKELGIAKGSVVNIVNDFGVYIFHTQRETI